MRVAVFGAAGQLGRELVHAFSGSHAVSALTRSDCDVSDYEAVMAACLATGPELILNASAMTAVDACEKDVDTAFAINAMGPRNLALAANHLGAMVVHVSTDYVFDGDADRPYDEWDSPNPISVYGRSKLGGEREVLDIADRCYVVRTGVVFSTKAPNFALAILDRGGAGDEALAVVADQVGSPTYAPHLAAGIKALVLTGRFGLYHAAGAGACSRADMARVLLGAAGHDPARVQDVTSDVMAEAYPAPRPKMAALECRAWRIAGLEPLPPWQDGVAALVAELGLSSLPPAAVPSPDPIPAPAPVPAPTPEARVAAPPDAPADAAPALTPLTLDDEVDAAPPAPAPEPEPAPAPPPQASVHVIDASASDLAGGGGREGER